MNGIAKVNVQPQIRMAQPARVAFKGTDKSDTIENVVDAATDAFDKVTKDPNETTIKTGIAAVMTVIGLFLAKQAPKIKALIDKGKVSNNKFLKGIAIAAGVVMSLLSVFGASKLFEGKVADAEKAQGDAKGDTVEKEPPVDEATDVQTDGDAKES